MASTFWKSQRAKLAVFLLGPLPPDYAAGFGCLFRKPILLGFGCPDGVWVGSGVSEALAAFVTTLATVYGSHDGRALHSIGTASNLEVGHRRADGVLHIAHKARKPGVHDFMNSERTNTGR